MIKVKDLVKRLHEFVLSHPMHGEMEVMLAYESNVALQFGVASDHRTFSPRGTVERFLVLKPDLHSRLKIELTDKEVINDTGTSR